MKKKTIFLLFQFFATSCFAHSPWKFHYILHAIFPQFKRDRDNRRAQQEQQLKKIESNKKINQIIKENELDLRANASK